MSDYDNNRPLPTSERVAEVRAATAELEQIQPDDDAVKQRKSAAKARCKKAKVRDKYRKVAADIAVLDDDQKEGALGELAIALHAHGLPLALDLPEDPQLDMFDEDKPVATIGHNGGEPLDDGDENGSSDRPAAGRRAAAENTAEDEGFEEADPESAATLDDPALDVAGYQHNAAADLNALDAAEQDEKEEVDPGITSIPPKVGHGRGRRAVHLDDSATVSGHA